MHQQRLGQIRKWTTMQWQLLRCNNWGSLNSICNLHKTLFIFSKEFILFKSFTHVLELVMWVCGMPPWFVPTQKRKKPGNSSEGFAGSGPAQSEQRNPLDVGAHSLVGGSCNYQKSKTARNLNLSPGEILPGI